MKKILSFVSVLALSLSLCGVVLSPKVFAATRTWDGGGSDNNMTTAANWSSDTAPSAGDDLVFPADITDRTITNDFTAATSFNSIAFTGTATADSNYTITGNSITLVAGITHTMTGSFNLIPSLNLPIILGGSQTFNAGSSSLNFGGTLNLGSNTLTFNSGSSLSSITGVISGSGNLTKTGSGALNLTGNNAYTGNTTVSAGQLAVGETNGLGTSAGGTTVTSGASLILYKGSGDATYDEPLTLAGTGLNGYSPAVSIANGFGMGGAPTLPYSTSTLSGPITLTANTTLGTSYRHIKITGAITGSYAISLSDVSIGTLEIASSSNGSTTPNKTLEPPVKETAYDADSAGTPIEVNYNETAIVKGTYGDTTVNPKGTLKGTGTVENLVVFGTLAPGLSPGCLNTSDLTLHDGSTYAFEVGGTTACTQYDQTKATGTVQAGGTLTVTLYNGFKPTAGQKYVIVANDGTDAVNGTFANAAQGATVTSGGYSFSVSYTGGDGNDIELTALGTAPSTGLALIKNNPVVTLSITTGAAALLLLLARRNKLATGKRR